MNITLYMAVSIDGQIARNNDETPWSDESWDSYNNFVNDSDVLVIGRKTYDIMFEEKSLEDITVPVYVLTDGDNENIHLPIISSVESFIAFAEKNNWQNIVVAGGAQTNASFLKAKKLDRIIIDVEPKILGRAKPLFDIVLDELKVDELPEYKLVDFKRLENSDTIQLLYTYKD